VSAGRVIADGEGGPLTLLMPCCCCCCCCCCCEVLRERVKISSLCICGSYTLGNTNRAADMVCVFLSVHGGQDKGVSSDVGEAKPRSKSIFVLDSDSDGCSSITT
jgi:hypothetical protein